MTSIGATKCRTGIGEEGQLRRRISFLDSGATEEVVVVVLVAEEEGEEEVCSKFRTGELII